MGVKIVFGYVKLRRGDLRIKEYEFYKAVYCGLCHHEKRLSRRLRYTLSYDMVLLALLRLGATGERSCFLKKRCPVHPVKGCLTVDRSESLRYTAAASAILLYEKLKDDIADERGFRRFAAKLMAKGAYKAMKHDPMPLVAERVREGLFALAECEKRGSSDVYEGADLFGRMLGEVFCYDNGTSLSREAVISLREIGYRVGRFIYMLDAYADRLDDQKEKKYNPFNRSGEDLEDSAFRERLLTALDMEMVQASVALDLLAIDDGGIRAILENLLKLGLPDTARAVVTGQKTHDMIIKETRKAYDL